MNAPGQSDERLIEVYPGLAGPIRVVEAERSRALLVYIPGCGNLDGLAGWLQWDESQQVYHVTRQGDGSREIGTRQVLSDAINLLLAEYAHLVISLDSEGSQ